MRSSTWRESSYEEWAWDNELPAEDFRLLQKLWRCTHHHELPVQAPLSRSEARRIALSLLHVRLGPEESLRHWLRVGGSSLACAPDGSELSYNLRRTLRLLLAGESEEEIAQGLHVTRQVAHAYENALYAKFGVQNRSELMALWIWPGFQKNEIG